MAWTPPRKNSAEDLIRGMDAQDEEKMAWPTDDMSDVYSNLADADTAREALIRQREDDRRKSAK